MKDKARVYCTNAECSKRHTCSRYVSRPVGNMLTRKYAETWNGHPCEKYVPSAGDDQQAYLRIDEPAARGRIQSPEDIELREHLVRLVSDNFDTLFMREMSWNSGTAYNIPLVAGRVVDLLMPVMARNMRVRKHR